MTYDAAEKSIYGAQPVELYRFTRGLTIWTHTSADVPIVYNGETYTPQTMRRGELAQNSENDNAVLDLYLDPTIDVAAHFVSGGTPGPTNVTLIRRHRDDATLTEQAVLFMGQVGSVEFNTGEAHFTCVPFQRATQRKIPRILYQTTCNHMLYDQFCTINPAAFTNGGVITAITGRTLTVPDAAGQPDGYYNGGYVRDGDNYAFIETHVGSQLAMLNVPPSFALVDIVSMTAGCDRRQSTCIGKFANLPNFMGWPFIPDLNPYTSSLVQS